MIFAPTWIIPTDYQPIGKQQPTNTLLSPGKKTPNRTGKKFLLPKTPRPSLTINLLDVCRKIKENKKNHFLDLSQWLQSRGLL